MRTTVFPSCRKNIAGLKTDASDIKSVTLGINLNNRFEPNGIGIVSINSKYFTKSGIISNFCDFLNRGDELQKDTEWKQKYSFRTGGNGVSTAALEKTADTMFRANHPVAGLVTPTADARADDVMHTLDRAATAMLSGTVRKLKQILSRHVNVSTQVIAGADSGADILHPLGRVY